MNRRMLFKGGLAAAILGPAAVSASKAKLVDPPDQRVEALGPEWGGFFGHKVPIDRFEIVNWSPGCVPHGQVLRYGFSTARVVGNTQPGSLYVYVQGGDLGTNYQGELPPDHVMRLSSHDEQVWLDVRNVKRGAGYAFIPKDDL